MNISYNRRLELIQDKEVQTLLYDILHKRRLRFSKADNSGQHVDYKDMIKELEEDYRKEIVIINNK